MGSSDHITFWSFLVFDQFPEINAFLRTIFNNIFLLSLFLAFALTQWKETNYSFFLFLPSNHLFFASSLFQNVPIAFGLGQSIALCLRVWRDGGLLCLFPSSTNVSMYWGFHAFLFCICIYVCICICISYNSFIFGFLLSPPSSCLQGPATVPPVGWKQPSRLGLSLVLHTFCLLVYLYNQFLSTRRYQTYVMG